MSKRFQAWVEHWVEDNIVPGVHTDIESDDARAERLTERMFTEAVGAGFMKSEVEEERNRVLRLVKVVVTSNVEFDIEAYHVAWQLAMEHPDGD